MQEKRHIRIDPTEDPECLNTYQCGQLIKRSSGAVRNLVLRRAIPYRKVAGRLVFWKHEILEWIDGAPGLRLEEIDK